jgi:hypothetical protein
MSRILNAKTWPLAGLLLGLAATVLTQGCAASFEESSGKVSLAPVKAADPTLCATISGRARWEQALAVAGAGLTGAAGITAWPIESKDGRLGLAIGATVLAGGTALVLTLWQADAAEYIAAGCAAPKGSK